MKNSPFYKQAELLLRVIPHVAAETCFALKGGTAINLFVRDMPRLSVDLDLAYLPIAPRELSLKNISEALERIAHSIKKTIPGIKVQANHAQDSKRLVKLLVSYAQAQIKIEPNPVIRGCVFPSEARDLSRSAEELFELSVTIPTLSTPDLYGGKLCAALHRQHPRDIFDIKILMDNEGITNEIRQAFVVYLASHDRPIHELLDPTRKDIRQAYENEWAGMTAVPVPHADLISAREQFISILSNELTDRERKFLLSVKEGQPRWENLGIEGTEKLPAIQ